MKKRILAIALCLAVLMSVVPFSLTASAAEPEGNSIAIMDVYEPGPDGKISYNQANYAIGRWTTTELLLRKTGDTDFGAPWLFSHKLGEPGYEENFFKIEFNPALNGQTRSVITLLPGNYLWKINYSKNSNNNAGTPMPEGFEDGAEVAVGTKLTNAGEYNYIAFRFKVTGGEKSQLSQFIIHPYAIGEGGGSYDYPEQNAYTYEGGVMLNLNDRSVTELGAVTKFNFGYNFDGWVVLPSTAIKSPNKSIAELMKIGLEFKKASNTNNWIGRTLWVGDILAVKNLEEFTEYRLGCKNTEGGAAPCKVVASKVVDPTCTSDGYTKYECKFCDYSVNRDYVNKLSTTGEHSYVSKGRVAATCTHGSYEKLECTTCGDIIKRNVFNDATGHVNILINEEVGAGCHTDGYKFKQCACGEVLVDETIPMTAKQTITGAVKASCTTDGNTGKHTCQGCGITYDQGTKIPAYGHTEKLVGKKDATCKEAGYTGDMVCETCKTTTKKGSTIAKLTTHTFGEWKVVKEATDTVNGSKQRECSVCKKTETAVIPATGSLTPSIPDDSEGEDVNGDNSASGNEGDGNNNAGNNNGGGVLSPPTGENASGLYIWIAVLAVSICAVVVLSIVLGKKKTTQK